MIIVIFIVVLFIIIIFIDETFYTIKLIQFSLLGVTYKIYSIHFVLRKEKFIITQ